MAEKLVLDPDGKLFLCGPPGDLTSLASVDDGGDIDCFCGPQFTSCTDLIDTCPVWAVPPASISWNGILVGCNYTISITLDQRDMLKVPGNPLFQLPGYTSDNWSIAGGGAGGVIGSFSIVSAQCQPLNTSCALYADPNEAFPDGCSFGIGLGCTGGLPSFPNVWRAGFGVRFHVPGNFDQTICPRYNGYPGGIFPVCATNSLIFNSEPFSFCTISEIAPHSISFSFHN